MKDYGYTDLVNLYRKHVSKPQEYFDKYKKVPLSRQHPNWKWDNHDYARIPCLLDFEEWIRLHDIRPSKMLYTSEEDPELLYINPSLKTSVEYDMATHKNDLHTLDLPDKDYDFILFSQTIEHLHSPYIALERLKEHLIPGGYIFTSVPIINIAHMTPVHFWGITQMGLITLFDSLDFNIIRTGQWGNKEYLNFIFNHQWWPDYRNLIDRHGIIENEPLNACQCWILVRK